MNEKFKAILLFGPVCAGKGTVGKRLQKENSNLYYISSGDMVRELKEGMQYHSEVRSYIKNGKLIPDEVILPLFKHGLANRIQRMDYNPSKQILLVDGMYRTITQAEDLEQILELKDVLHLAGIPDLEIIKRANLRAREQGRLDDNTDAVNFRIKEYQMDTFLVLDFLKNKGIPIFDINGCKQPDEVFLQAKEHTEKEMQRYFC